MSQLAVAWCLKNESVNCLLLGATSVEQFKENIHALQVYIKKIFKVCVKSFKLLQQSPLRFDVEVCIKLFNENPIFQNETHDHFVLEIGGIVIDYFM